MASPTFDKLPLENALDDSPQIRTLVGLFAADSQALKDYVTTLHQLSSKLVAAHNQLTSAYQDLAKHLKAYKNIKFSVDNEKGEAVAENLEKFASHISEMSSWEHIVATQIADGSVYPLSRFIDTELHEMDTMASLHQNAGLDMEKAISRYSRCRRKDPEMERREANEDVYVTRKKFHQMALHYYAKMNQLQYSHKIALLEPVLGLLVATRAHYNMGHDTLSVPKLEDFLSTVSVSAKSIHEDQMKERNETLELIDSIITQSQLMYYAQPPADIAALPPDTTLTTKSGYLNVQKKYMGVMSSWERQYVFVEGGNLMGVAKGEAVGSLLLEIDSSTVVHATDTDDRLHVFQVATSKKYITLQALNDRERDEWMLTIHNLGKDGGYIKDEKVVPPSLLSGVGQFFADKFHAASAAIGSTPPTPTLASSTATTTSTASTGATSSPPEVVAIPPDAPIMFDLLTSTEETLMLDMNSENDESAGGDVVLKEDESRTFFGVRFLGSMGVNVDRGQSVVCEVMRRILAARAIHNLFSTTELKLCITSTHLVLADPASSAIRLQHSLKEIAYWAAHTENHKLVGYIVRQSDNNGLEGTKFSCFVYEADVSGTDVCSALGVAAKAAYEQLLEKKTFEKKRKQETKLLLANIAQLPDISDPPKVSSDGQFLILDGDVPGESPTHSPPAVPRLPQPAPAPRFPPPAEEEHPESEA
ncbi:DCC-interacting protein 13-alpha-like isoform X2 [Portunus trituberculatus]|uniref:DCC-interacting protein 13-alpha-like isoform X2 n=1 Tax=Portunus trituberculatus TaxID=210409 RepID=UPI001E1CBA56|nr:DCC-interacting protein 13-alpha-like isoform X2 [Portunus trituberculatus]